MPIQEMPTIIHENLDNPRVRTPLLPSVRKNTKPMRKPWFYAAALVILAAVAGLASSERQQRNPLRRLGVHARFAAGTSPRASARPVKWKL